MKQKSVGLSLRALIIALALILVAGSPALPPFDGVAYAQAAGPTLTATETPGGGGVSLNWTAVDDADSYQVWKGTGSGNNVSWGSSPLATVTTTSYSDTAVTAGSTYSYAVRSVENGTNGAWSNVPSVTVSGGVSAPTAKSTVTAAGSGLSTINVSWTTVAGATSYDLQYWVSGLGGWTSLVSGGTGTSYSHTGLTAGSTYYYVVRGVNTGGNGPWADWASHTLEAFTTVPELTLTHTSREVVDLSWTATSSTATYNVQRGKSTTADATQPPAADTDAGGRAWANISAAQSGLSYTDNNATYGTVTGDNPVVRYYYRVQAVENGLAGDWSTVKKVIIPATSNRLAAPTFPTSGASGASAASSSNINFVWNVVAGATFYQVRYKMGDGDYGNPVRVEPPTTGATVTYAHSGLSPSTKYTYQARAVNVNGPSDWSAASSATTHSTASATGQMPKVTGLTLKETTTTPTGSETSYRVELKWNQVSDATHYEIKRWHAEAGDPSWAATSDGDPAQSGGFLAVTALASAAAPKWEDRTGLAPGNTYYYVVSAVDGGPQGISNAADNDLGEWSDYKAITLKAIKPVVPTALQTTATSQSTVWVSWVAPATDSAGAATAYDLEWRLATGGANWNRIHVTGTTYNHTGRSAGTIYHYRVRGKNSGGEGPFTTEVSVTTLPANLAPPSSGLMAADATSGDTVQIKVSWAAVAGATGYEIQRYNPANGNWTNLTGGDDGTFTTVAKATGTVSQLDTNANTAGTTYSYRVRTVNGSQKSLWSAVVSGMTKHAAPTAEDVKLVATTTGHSMIRLSWEAVDNATSYTLEFVEGRVDAAEFNNALVNRTSMELAGTTLHYVHTGLKAGTQYSYRLRANLPAGVVSPWALPTAQPYTRPLKPELTATAASATSMTLSWDAVAFVTDADPPAAGHLAEAANYVVQRRAAGTSTWIAVSEDATCTNNKCTLTNGSLTASTHYYYRIRATVTRDSVVYTSYWDYANQRTPAASQ